MTDTSTVDYSLDDLRQQRAAGLYGGMSVEDSPDDAARAMDLSEASGVPAGIIHNDLKEFERRYQAGLATNIINENRYIADYVNRHSMHAKVSNDDWGNLGELSKNIEGYQATKFSRRTADEFARLGARTAGLQGAPSIFDTISDLLRPGMGWSHDGEEWKPAKSFDQVMQDVMKEHPLGVASVLDYLAAGIKQALTAPREALQGRAVSIDPETGMPMLGGTVAEAFGTATFMLGGTEFKRTPPLSTVREFIDQNLGPIPSQGMGTAENIKRFIQERAEFEAARARGEDVRPGPTYKAFVDKIEPFVKAKESPPPGIDPIVNKAYEEQAKASAEAWKEVEEAFDKANTPQRSPPAARAFVQTHPPDSVGISADGIQQVYGDKVPQPGDGILGDVPGVVEGHDVSAMTGAPIEVDTSEYLTGLKKEQRKELEEHLVHSDGGISLAEAKELGETKLEGSAGAPMSSRLQQAYDAAVSELGTVQIPISELVKRSGIPQETIHKILIDASKSGDVNLYSPGFSTEEQLAAAIDHPGWAGPVTDVEFKKPLGAAAPAEPEPPKGPAETILAAVRQGAGLKPPEPPKPLGPPEGKPPPAEGELAHRAEAPFKSQYGPYMKKVQAELDAEARWAERMNEVKTRLQQTKEWKERAAAIRAKVVEDMAARPDVALDTFLRDGVLEGDKYPKHYIDSDMLTPEQMAGIDPKFFKKDGHSPAEVSDYFGYPSVDAMLRDLREAEETRRQQGVGSRQWFRDIVDSEVNARLEKEFGSLEEKILDEAREFVASPTTLERVYAELENEARNHGVPMDDHPKFTRMVEAVFNNLALDKHSVRKYLNAAGKAGRGIERELLKDKFVPAFAEKLRQVTSLHMAKLAKGLEKDIASFEREVKQLSKREPSGIPREYNIAFHDILHRLGIETEISPQQLEVELQASGYKGLADFVNDKEKTNYQTMDGVPAWLLDPRFNGPWKKLTPEAFQELRDGIQVLKNNAKFDGLVTLTGKEINLRNTLDSLKGTFEGKPIAIAVGEEGMVANGAKFGRAMLGALMQMETIARRLDDEKHTGPWHQNVTFPAHRAATKVKEMEREVAGMIRKLPVINGNAAVPNDLIMGPSGKPMKLRVENLIRMATNLGTESGWDALYKGEAQFAGQDPVTYEYRLWRMIDGAMTKEYWQYVRGLWDIFEYIKQHTDDMVRSQGGIPKERLAFVDIPTRHGPVKGGYAPIRNDDIRLKPGGLSDWMTKQSEMDYMAVRTSMRHEHERTGAYGPANLSLKVLGNDMHRQIQDVGFRPLLRDLKKLVFNNDIQNLFNKHLGPQIGRSAMEWLRDLGERPHVGYQNEAVAVAALDRLIDRTIGQFVMFNPITIVKHAGTAWLHSFFMRVDPRTFAEQLTAGMADTTMSHLTDTFADLNSKELPYRARDLAATIGGAREISLTKGKLQAINEALAAFTFAPFQKMDYWSARYAWKAAYIKEWQRLASEPGVDVFDQKTRDRIHEKAVEIGDYAVRMTHGTAATPSQPSILRQSGPIRSLTKLMTFFSNQFQREYEMGWSAREMGRGIDRGDWQTGFKYYKRFLGKFWTWILMTAVGEEFANSMVGNETWGHMATMGIIKSLTGGIPVVRELPEAIARGRVDIGTFGEPAEEMQKGVRQLTKRGSLSERNAGETIEGLAHIIGPWTKVPLVAPAKAGRFLYNYSQGREHPEGWIFGSKTHRSVLGGIARGTAVYPPHRR